MPYPRFLIPAVGALAVVGVLLYQGLGSNLVYYLTPSEAVERRAEFPDGERFRLAGLVAADSYTQEGSEWVFSVTDGATVIPVRLTKAPPQLFDEDVPVVLEGAWSGEVFVSDLALVRHDENYEAPPVTAVAGGGG